MILKKSTVQLFLVFTGLTIILVILPRRKEKIERKSPEEFANKMILRDPRHYIIKRKQTIEWCSELKYLNQTDNIVTGLISYPGSGNTWARYLLQQVSGIYTGSVYYDRELEENGFPGACVVNSSVLVVKAHYEYKQPIFSRIILLVRKPEDAILSEFNRLTANSHTGSATLTDFQSARWADFAKTESEVWRWYHLKWSQEFAGKILVVHFKDLKTKLEETLRKILKFINFPVDEDLLECTLDRRTGKFKRRKKKRFQPYTKQMLRYLGGFKDEVYPRLEKYEKSISKTPITPINESAIEQAKLDCLFS